MNFKKMFYRLVYHLTKTLPLPLPENESDWAKIKFILTTYFGVPNTPEVWTTIAGHIGAMPSHKSHTTYFYLATIGRRLQINKAAQMERASHREALEAKLKAKMEELAHQEEQKEAATTHIIGATNGQETGETNTIPPLPGQQTSEANT